VQAIGGEAVQLEVILPLNSDPHSFEPTPQDAAAMTQADLVFINGLGFEAFIEPMLESVADQTTIISVSEGIQGIPVEQDSEEGLGLGQFQDDKAKRDQGQIDPHVWFDPSNVSAWTHNIVSALVQADPDNSVLYAENAQAYRQDLQALDLWIQDAVARIPIEQRRLVTDHDSLIYFTQRYGFELVATIIPGYSTLAEPSARDLATVSSTIKDLRVPAVFVGSTVNSDLAERVAEETGVQLVPIYTGSLSESGGPAANYLDFMRTNVTAIVNALVVNSE